jgi:glyoxylase-like metal-dependent hydrolase (beta-lactamase superfamily II)/rhodanese-related sulfurtransferase
MIFAIRKHAGKAERRNFAAGVILSSGLMMGFCPVVLSDSGGIDAELIQGDAYLDQIKSKIKNVDTAQVQQMIENVPGLVLLDIREAAEIPQSGGTIDAPRVHNVSRGWVEFRVPERVPDKDTPIVVFCNLNLRSPLVAKRLMDMGYTNVSNYEDGFPSWRDGGYPVINDTAPGNMLFQAPVQISDNVWSAIGATAPPSYENSGHNNNLSFIITSQGVVVVNAGDNYLLAQSLHREIRKITDQPVKYVILENGQGHAMLGSNYWQAQGAEIVAHSETATVIKETGEDRLFTMMQGRRDKGMDTQLAQPDIVFEDEYVIELGDERIEALYLGPAHSPGDISVWLPRQKMVIAGDIAFHERLLPVMEDTDTAGWIETWQKFEALGATTVVPGHGRSTDYQEVRKYTVDYLEFMRQEMGQLIEDGGELQDAYTIDQSAYSHLDTYFELARQNAGRIFREMEFDF